MEVSQPWDGAWGLLSAHYNSSGRIRAPGERGHRPLLQLREENQSVNQ